MDVLGDLSAAVAGGVTGLFGAVVGRLVKLGENWQEHRFRREERSHELALLRLQGASRREESEAEAQPAAD